MLNFLKGIGSIITSIANFVLGLIEDLLYIVELIGQVVANLPSYFSWVPDEVYTALALIFVVVVIYKILGREG